jgi:hypothetical protein
VAAVLDENGGLAAGRAALGRVSHRAANTVGARRPAAPPPAQPTPHGSALGSGATAAAGNVTGFAIFADTSAPQPFAFLDDDDDDDDAAAATTSHSEGGAAPLWGDLAPLEERLKENTDVARRWNDPSVVASLAPRPALPAAAVARRRGNASEGADDEAPPLLRLPVPPPSARPVPAGAIFVEDAFAPAADGDAESGAALGGGALGGLRSGESGGLSVRAALDRPATAAEALALNPLAFFERDDGGAKGSGGGGSDDSSAAAKSGKLVGKKEKKAPLGDKVGAAPEAPKVPAAPEAPAAAPEVAAPFDFVCGFAPALVVPNVAGGPEQCFEEHRAAAWLKRNPPRAAQPQEKLWQTAAPARSAAAPFAVFNDAAPTVAAALLPSSSSSSSLGAAAAVRRNDDVTINTSMALEAMGDIFGPDDDHRELAAMWGDARTAGAAPLQALQPLSFASPPPAATSSFGGGRGAASGAALPPAALEAGPFALSSSPAPKTRAAGAVAVGAGLCTPPPARLPFAIFADDAPAAAAAEGQARDENADAPVNPAARTVAAVAAAGGEGAVLRELRASEVPAALAAARLREAEANSGEGGGEDGEGPMPEEAEIYRSMLGLPEAADDELHRGNLRGLDAQLDFAIYHDDDAGGSSSSGPGGGAWPGSGAAAGEDATADAGALAGLLREVGCASPSDALGRRRETVALGSLLELRRGLLGADDTEPAAPRPFVIFSDAAAPPSASSAAPLAIFSDAAAPPSAPSAAPFAIFSDATVNSGGESTVELGAGLLLPQLATIAEVASPSGRGRRATADPAFLLDMLAQFQDDHDDEATATALLPAAPALQPAAGLPFSIFQDE